MTVSATKFDRAADLLRDLLPATVPELKAAAAAAGIGWGTMLRARYWLHITWSRDHGFQSPVTWRFIDHDTNPRRS